ADALAPGRRNPRAARRPCGPRQPLAGYRRTLPPAQPRFSDANRVFDGQPRLGHGRAPRAPWPLPRLARLGRARHAAPVPGAPQLARGPRSLAGGAAPLLGK
nr:hypothetical protein [Tanacetum cinerariifolium]